MKRAKKIIALLLAVTMLVGINTSYVNAEDKEGCVQKEECEHYFTREGVAECINCSYGIPHPCSVDGRLVSCQPHYYTYRIPVYCDLCGAFLYYYYDYHEVHQYSHN